MSLILAPPPPIGPLASVYNTPDDGIHASETYALAAVSNQGLELRLGVIFSGNYCGADLFDEMVIDYIPAL